MDVKRRIDQKRVLDVAVALADEHGFEAVTLASVAEKLGIRIPSLYNHVAGLQGLRYLMRVWGLQQLTKQVRNAAVGKAGDDAIFAIADAYRAFALAHPGVYPATLKAPADDETALAEVAEELLGILKVILEPYSAESDSIVHMLRALRSLMHGFVDLEIAGGFGIPLDRDESFRQLIERFVRSLG